MATGLSHCHISLIPSLFRSTFTLMFSVRGTVCITAVNPFTLYLLTRALQDLNKRLSLPADIRIPDGYLEKLQLSSPPFDQPLSRRSRRASLVSAAVRTIRDVPVELVWRVFVTFPASKLLRVAGIKG